VFGVSRTCRYCGYCALQQAGAAEDYGAVVLVRYRRADEEEIRPCAKAENIFGETLKSLFAVAESYPELKANVNFQQLQTQLKELEDNIESARRYYNAVVRDYNILTQTFPSNLVASQFRFGQEEFFELEEPAAERKPVKVSFS
jgi:LemA protein